MEPQLPGSPDIFHAEITRGDAAALELREGDTIYVRALRIPRSSWQRPARSELRGNTARPPAHVAPAAVVVSGSVLPANEMKVDQEPGDGEHPTDQHHLVHPGQHTVAGRP